MLIPSAVQASHILILHENGLRRDLVAYQQVLFTRGILRRFTRRDIGLLIACAGILGRPKLAVALSAILCEMEDLPLFITK